MPDGVYTRRPRDWVALLSVLATATLAVSLFIVVSLLSASNRDNADLRDQLATSSSEQSCRVRFQNDDERLDRLGDLSFRAALLASVGPVRNPELVAALDEYDKVLGPAALAASVARTASPETCKENPTAFPIPVDLPPFPTR